MSKKELYSKMTYEDILEQNKKPKPLEPRPMFLPMDDEFPKECFVNPHHKCRFLPKVQIITLK